MEMSDATSLRVSILLSVQRALLGAVPPALRAVTVSWDERFISLRCYFDGTISDDDFESMRVMETEVFSDFFPQRETHLEVIRVDAPARLESVTADPTTTCVFARKEYPNYPEDGE